MKTNSLVNCCPIIWIKNVEEFQWIRADTVLYHSMWLSLLSLQL